MKILLVEKLGGGLLTAMAIVCLLAGLAVTAVGQYAMRPDDPNNLQKPAGVNIPANGSGVMVAGELWDSYMPANKGPYYSEAARTLVEDFIRMGNFDRQWSTPTHMWPGGWQNGNFWNKDMYCAVYDPDTTFNPATIGGAANPSYVAASGPNYAIAAFANKPTLSPPRVVLGATDPLRNYARETKWVDATKRHHALYEAGWPTTVGLDVKLEAHQYSLNWNNFNDFIMLKVTVTNTGNVDLNADGVAEKTNHRIPAVAFMVNGENMSSYSLGTNAGRGNRFGSQRVQAYNGSPDAKGNPVDMLIGFPGESVNGKKDMGLNDFPNRFYTEVWSGWSWMGVKKSDGTDKNTIFGTHPIGATTQRGWYTSAGMGRGLSFGFGNPKGTFVTATSTWYVDGGKLRNSATLNLAPNANYFASGIAGNVTTFVPKASPTRPNGDRKLYSEEATNAFEVNPYEPSWTKGFAAPSNFDGDMYSGVGPFSLDVGESMTVTWVCVGGYRLEGIQNAMAAARYIYDNGDVIADDYPAVPEIRIDFKAPGIPQLRWDNRAETHANFGGYKIYRQAQAIPIDWTKTGMRVLDNYWQNMTPGPLPDSYKKPMNPSFAAFDFIANKIGVPDTWGPYDLVKVIPQGELSQYQDGSTTGFNYSWLDDNAPMGLKFWYYVSAYTKTGPTLNATYSGSNPLTVPFIETSNVNRNGATGLWVNTYPWAYLNADFPKTAQGLKDIGYAVTVQRYAASYSELTSGAKKISVKPNPYKKRAVFDNFLDASDHKILFYNLPPKAKITILDVVGQIIQVIDFVSPDPSNGMTYWNMFSKNGVEVASGLYIYVAEYEGGKQVGYFTIMR